MQLFSSFWDLVHEEIIVFILNFILVLHIHTHVKYDTYNDFVAQSHSYTRFIKIQDRNVKIGYKIEM